ncbi:soluble quino protein glucose dehydrogenase [Xylariaceae sp. FL0016]|nr:soluble quino protein glucose dehydrogenase [Xylariaceae sp. FL0016]
MTRTCLVAVFGLLTSTAIAQNCTAITPSAELNVTEGYTAHAILNGLKIPRNLAFDTGGSLLVSEQNAGGIRRIVLTEDTDGNVCVASSSQIIPDPRLNHGIVFSEDGKTLFVSTMGSVDAYPYDAAAGTVGDKKTIIEGMSSGGHTTRTLLVPMSAPDTLLVARGSDGNIDNSTTDISTGKSMVKAFNITELMASSNATDFAEGGEVLAWGLRNSVGVGEEPTLGGIFSVENSADDIHRSDVDLHNENPAEEMNYHGSLTDHNNTMKGRNYGYPACFSAWQTTNIPDNEGITIGSQFGGLAGTPFQQVTAADSIQDVDEFCRTQRQGPRLVFPAHTAPLDIKFKADGSAAYVTFHGSWDRDPPDGFRLGRIEFKEGQPVADVSDTNAVTYVVQNKDLTKCPGACIRPVGLAFDKKGRLFMTSDESGELYVVTGT